MFSKWFINVGLMINKWGTQFLKAVGNGIHFDSGNTAYPAVTHTAHMLMEQNAIWCLYTSYLET